MTTPDPSPCGRSDARYRVPRSRSVRPLGNMPHLRLRVSERRAGDGTRGAGQPDRLPGHGGGLRRRRDERASGWCCGASRAGCRRSGVET